MPERATQRQPRFSLRELFVVVTSLAILANIVTVDVTKSITSIVGLMVAAGLVVVGATYWAWRCNRSSTHRRPVELALWLVVAWGLFIFLGTVVTLVGRLLSKTVAGP